MIRSVFAAMLACAVLLALAHTLMTHARHMGAQDATPEWRLNG